MSTYLIVGLGNPEAKYETTRHNIGWLQLDHLAEDLGIDFQLKSQFQSWLAQGRHQNHKILLCKPTTYMNLSGNAVQPIMAYYKVLPEQLVVVCDDVHIEFGRLRLRLKGSSGGQKGIQSIIQRLGHDQFARLKMGVGPFPQGRQMANFVLKPFPKDQWEQLPFIMNHTNQSLFKFISEGGEAAVPHCNGYRLNP